MVENAKWMQEICCIFNAHGELVPTTRWKNFSFMGYRYMGMDCRSI
jgi:hypothetical protein